MEDIISLEKNDHVTWVPAFENCECWRQHEVSTLSPEFRVVKKQRQEWIVYNAIETEETLEVCCMCRLFVIFHAPWCVILLPILLPLLRQLKRNVRIIDVCDEWTCHLHHTEYAPWCCYSGWFHFTLVMIIVVWIIISSCGDWQPDRSLQSIIFNRHRTCIPFITTDQVGFAQRL